EVVFERWSGRFRRVPARQPKVQHLEHPISIVVAGREIGSTTLFPTFPGGAGHEPGEGAAVAALVFAGEAIADGGGAVAGGQRDGAAAESAARHARAEDAAR